MEERGDAAPIITMTIMNNVYMNTHMQMLGRSTPEENYRQRRESVSFKHISKQQAHGNLSRRQEARQSM